MAIECEFKWQAQTGQDFSRMLAAVKTCFKGSVQGPVEILNRDYYLDTPLQLWSQHKTALRIRCANGVFEATAKSQTKMIAGKAVRQENTLPLLQAQNIQEAMRLLEAKQSWQNLPLEGLKVVFCIINHRRIYNLLDKDSLYELALDDCQLRAGIQQKNLKEIELELKHGDEKIFSTFAAQLHRLSGLKIPDKSKVETARTLLEGMK